MHLLWLLLLVPVGLIALGILIHALGDFDPPSSGFSPRQIVRDILMMAATGLWGLIMLGVVFAPALLLFYVASLSYGASACIGLPIGFAILFRLFHRLLTKKADKTNGHDGPVV
jgi:vacuolar-type H+-ATPase subunit I/STV1